MMQDAGGILLGLVFVLTLSGCWAGWAAACRLAGLVAAACCLTALAPAGAAFVSTLLYRWLNRPAGSTGKCQVAAACQLMLAWKRHSEPY